MHALRHWRIAFGVPLSAFARSEPGQSDFEPEAAMKVSEAMHIGVTWATPNTPVIELARLMLKDEIGAIPIGHADRLVGMVTDRDIVCRCIALGLDPHKVVARDVMSKGVVWCREDEELADAALLMQDKQVRRLPVINESKRMVGMLALGDVWHTAPDKIAAELMSRVSAHHH